MPHFTSREYSERFRKSYQKAPDELKKQVDKTIGLLIEDPSHPGLNAHSIKNAKYYWEAYINRATG